MEQNIVSIGLIQISASADLTLNFQKACAAIREAASRGAQIICLPELFLSEYFCQTRDARFFSLAEPILGPRIEYFKKLALELEVVFVISLYEQADGPLYFNTAAVIDADGALLGIYRKMHIPNDPDNGYDEAYYFSPGNLGIKVFTTRFATIAPMVCWDQWFPEGARLAAAAGAEILFYPTAIGWPLKDRKELNQKEHEAWQIMHKSHAIANNVHVVAVNRVGLEHQLRFWGTSFVADPYGHVLAQGSTDCEELLVVPCNKNTTQIMRQDWPFLESRRIRYEV